jgi:uncharacterized linocin/CFP29 family protein
MNTDLLRRRQAPISERVWNQIDDAARRAAVHVLAGRRIADFDGPKGWDHVGARLGTLRPSHTSRPSGTARMAVPDVSLLTEIRADFVLPWAAVDMFDRGAPALDTSTVETAAHDVAQAEDHLVFFGDGEHEGILSSPKSPRVGLGDWTEPGRAVADLISAIDTLDRHGIGGPYVAILDPTHFNAFYQAQASGCGYPASEQVKERVKDVYRSAVLSGGAVASCRGGDFVITVGGDLSVGYQSHDSDVLHLFCLESVAAQLVTPEAVCLLNGVITATR